MGSYRSPCFLQGCVLPGALPRRLVGWRSVRNTRPQVGALLAQRRGPYRVPFRAVFGLGALEGYTSYPVQAFAHLREVAAGRAGERERKRERLDLDEQRARLAKESADEKELKNQLSRDELIPADQIETFLVSILSGVRTQILGVPTKVAALAYAAGSVQEAKEVIEKAVVEALQEISDALKNL